MAISRGGTRVVFCALLTSASLTFAMALSHAAGSVGETQGAHKQMGVYIVGPNELVVGGPASYRVVAHWTDAPESTGPLHNVRLRLELRKDKRLLRVLSRGRSDGFGEAALSFVVPSIALGEVTLRVVARSRWGRTVQEQKVQIIAGAKAQITTDKPLYGPGQTIRARALVLGNVGRKPVAGRKLVFLLFDSRGTAIARHEAQTSAFGIVSAEFPLAQEVNLGRYMLQVKLMGEIGYVGRKSVEVKRYELPTFGVALKTTRKHYQPGQKMVGEVFAKRFTGKPVQEARVELKISTWRCPPTRARGCVNTQNTLHTMTDRHGRARFSLRLPKEPLLPMDKGMVDVRAMVWDRSGNRSETVTSLPFTLQRLKLAMVVSGGTLLDKRDNSVHVLAATAQGESLTHGTVVLSDAQGVIARSPLDALGTATFTYRRRVKLSCSAGRRKGRGVTLKARVLDGQGHRRTIERCLPVRKVPLVIQAREALIRSGHPVVLALFAPGSKDGERAHVDMIKEGQIIATKQATLDGGKGSLTFTPSADMGGLVTLRGNLLWGSAGGSRVSIGSSIGSSHRVTVYVEAPTALKIKARIHRKSYEPGATAKLTFNVRESTSGKPVQAALGLHAVDKALLSLVKREPDSAELFFSLARWARLQSAKLPLKPGGRNLMSWLGDSGKGASSARQRAVRLLLSAVLPPEVSRWETDPWWARHEAWNAQAPRLIAAARKAIYRLRLAQKVNKGWVFRRDLVPRLVAAGYAKKVDLRDPWGRVVRPEMLRKMDKSLVFASIARRVAEEKLKRLYALLTKRRAALGLKRIYLPGMKHADLPLRLPRDLMRRLQRHPRFAQRWLLYDPWGTLWRVKHHADVVLERYGGGLFASQQEVLSWGPDGKADTKDDVRMDLHRQPLKTTLLAALCLMNRCSKHCKECGGYGVGYGSGSGRLGGRRARPPLVRCGSASPRGVVLAPHRDRPRAKVRSRFVESFLWRPEVITNKRGRAEVSVRLPDGITTYRLFASASSRSGLFGSTALDLQVFQPFFVSFRLPPRVSAGDRLTAAVMVHNHTAKTQQVKLSLKLPPGVAATGPQREVLTLSANEVRVARFPLRFGSHGRRVLVVEAEGRDAKGKVVRDAIRREINVRPDGAEQVVAVSGSLVSGETTAPMAFALPPGIISGTGRVGLSFDAGPVQQAMQGLESILRSPHGCFEQTSSAVYPNLLVLDYLRRVRRSSPAVEKKARGYLAKGYQRLLTFEVAGGGFSWFGRAPANQVLTAYGLMEFSDMARLRDVDPKLIARTRRWILARQQKDGSWAKDAVNIRDGVVNHLVGDQVRRTAYITRALLHSGARGRPVEKALAYLRARVGTIKEPYTLALVIDALARRASTNSASTDAQKKELAPLLARLWKAQRHDKRGALIPGPKSTLTYGAGASADLEATGLAALASLRAGAPLDKISPMVNALMARRDRHGGWGTTQATILALQTLLSYGAVDAPVRGHVDVFVDGRRAARERIVAGKGKGVHIDLTRALAEGRHHVALRFVGKGRPRFRLVGRAFVPFARRVVARSPTLEVRSRFSRLILAKGETANLKVVARNGGKQALPMVMVSVPLPPGMHLSPGTLAGLAKLSRVQKVQLIDGAAVLYLDGLAPGTKVAFSLPFATQQALAVRVRPAAIWEYYRPENRGEDKAQRLVVR
ncbi:MAG: hypothetical protein JRH20_16770 [Deltaproteobacteria bacterium]|nr:hypothetical protein [Deltaproteobacteria bacterium]